MNEHHSFYNMKKVKSQWLFPPIHDFGVEFAQRSEEHTSELQSRLHLVCRLLLEKKNNDTRRHHAIPPRVHLLWGPWSRRAISQSRPAGHCGAWLQALGASRVATIPPSSQYGVSV